MARADVHFEACREAAVLDCESIPNRVVSADAADADAGLALTRSDLGTHLDQGPACVAHGAVPGTGMATPLALTPPLLDASADSPPGPTPSKSRQIW